MQEQYKHTIWGLTKIAGGISVGLAVGFFFTAVLKQIFNVINLEKLL